MPVNSLHPVKTGSKKKFLYKSAPLTLSTIIWGFSPAVSAIKDLTVINSSNTEFHFAVNFDNKFSGLNRQIGSDSLLYLNRAVQIAVPAGATPVLTNALGSFSTVLQKDSNNNNQKLAQMELASISKVWSMRSRQFVTVLISPVIGDNIFKQVEISLAFNNTQYESGVIPNDPQFNKIFASAIANWDVAQNWPAATLTAAKSTLQPGPFSVFADWYKIGVNQSGIHSLTFNQLSAAGLMGISVPTSTIFMYSGGGRQVNPLLTSPRPSFEQVAISIEDGGDGNFGPGDRILFYGESISRWLYDSAGAKYINNVYTNTNTYWLAVSTSITEAPLRMPTINVAPAGTAIDTIDTYDHYVRVEQENLNRSVQGIVQDFYNWYWSSSDSLEIFVAASNVVPGQLANIHLSAKTFDQTGSTDAIGYVDLSINGQTGLSKFCDFDSCNYQANNLISGLNRFTMSLDGFTSASLKIDPYFDHLELTYKRQTVPVSSNLDASFGPNNGTFRIDITDNFAANPLVFNLDETRNPKILTGMTRQGGLLSFEANLQPNSPNRFLTVSPLSLTSPTSVTKATPVDLHAPSSQTDLLIVTTAALAPAMSEYISYRNGQGISIKEIFIEDIMDNFGFGNYDPTAIRDYLKHAYENYPAPAPSAVLFVGDANYDYLDHLDTGVPNLVPSYLFQNDFTLSDDNYVYFGQYGLIDSDTSYVSGDRGFDMIVARWPVKSASEINRIIAKIKNYESPAGFGSWRSKVTFVTDDEIHPITSTNPPPVEATHTKQADTLSLLHVPGVLTNKKIYSWDYPYINRERPDVNTAIINEINSGTLLLDYVGHGSPDLWAHEHIFTRTSDLPRLFNGNKLPLFYAASCAISFFDDPKREGMAEDLLSMNGGAIGVIAATRLVYSVPNADFNEVVFDVLLYNDSLTICESLYAAKLLRQYISPTTPVPNTNDRNYLYFGDPYLRLGLPRYDVTVDASVDSLRALEPVTITGRISDKMGGVYTSDGQLSITVYDSERNRTHQIFNSSSTFSYKITGPTMFRGSATITNGNFDFSFIPPLDIGYGGNGARIALYAALDTVDAIGAIDSIYISNTVASTTDSIGPIIGVNFSGKALEPGGNVIQIGDILNLTLTDSSGINLTEGIGHGITLETDNDAASLKNLTSLFQYSQDDYTGGTLSYNLDSLQPGLHTFKIKAWDNANNSSVLEFNAEITTSADLAIRDLMNYPNPMSEKTNFSFSLTQSVSRFSLEIFTLSGRKINNFDRYTLAPAYYDDIVWDGRDSFGDPVATGVYLFKATAVPVTGDKVEEFGKVILINQ